MASGVNRDPLSNVDVVADNDPGGTAEQLASPQFNYRQPGEPEGGFRATEDDDWDGGVQGSHPKTKTQYGLSERAGMSEPKTLRQIDDENSWSSSR